MTSQNRLASADIYRGFVMFLMMAEVLHLGEVAKAIPSSSFWTFLGHHQDHIDWVGCTLHDMIQPSFSFLVGVVLPYSVTSRLQKNASFSQALWHAVKRSFILIALGIFLRSQYKSQTYFTFEDTLSQIGLGYTFLFILAFRSQKIQIITLVVLLFGYWLSFALYPLPELDFDYASAGVTKDWENNLSGFAAHWNKNTNLAWAFDRWFLNLFPREKPFLFNGGGYATLSFIPTLGTMILGLQAGNIFQSSLPSHTKLKRFILLGISGLVIGLTLNALGICPIVKRIWTPSWVLFSSGLCFLFLAFFYWIIDLKQSTEAYFLKVIGMNSIAAYCIADALGVYISKSLEIHLGVNYADILGIPYHSLIHGGLMLLIYWMILNWLYKKKIFIRV